MEMMKNLWFPMMLLFIQRTECEYPPKYENYDISEAISDEYHIKNLIDCLLDRIEPYKCFVIDTLLKKILPEMMRKNCVDCNEKQKDNLSKLYQAMNKEHAHDFEEILIKFGGDGVIY